MRSHRRSVLRDRGTQGTRHYDAEEDVRVEEDRFDEDEAAVGEGGGYPNHVPKQAFFFISACARRMNQG